MWDGEKSKGHKEHSRKRIELRHNTILYIIGVTIFFAFYELLKTFIMPNITMWESHIISINVVFILSTMLFLWFRRISGQQNDSIKIINQHLLEEVAAHKLTEKELKENERLLSEAQKVAHMGSYVIDLKAKTWKGSLEIYKIFGIDATYPHTLEGWIGFIHPDYHTKFFEYHSEVKTEKKRFDYEYKIIRINDGEERWVHGFGDLEFDNQRNAVRAIGIIQDITKRKKGEEENLYLSYHDALTELYNRRFYEQEIKRLDIEKNLPISIIIGDVNGLKVINDTFGHAKGDELLQKAAAIIKNACRTSDIVVRWGGDEFFILMPRTGLIAAEKIVKKIKDLYSEEYVNGIRVSISFGWDTKAEVSQDIQKVLKNAEDHMYKHKIIENENLKSNIVGAIISTLHEKNVREEQHSKRVSEICQNIGKAMGFSETKIGRLRIVGLLHDIGKIAVDEHILNKPGELTDQERFEINQHPEIGFRIISSSNGMLELAYDILAHHERWDGKGYPRGLKGGEIPMLARIIAIADSYDAMTSERSYRKALSEDAAIAEIRRNAGTQFDPQIAKIFIEKVLCKKWD